MPTYDMAVGYQFPSDRRYAEFVTGVRPSADVIELEISLNDEVCESTDASLDPSNSATAIRACVLEDIVAEKRRALLQQPIRRRYRKQDVYDIARIVSRIGKSLDRPRVGEYLIRKCARRDISPSRRAFDREIRDRAAFEYETLFDSSDPNFIPFDQAWALVLQLVGEIEIPA